MRIWAHFWALADHLSFAPAWKNQLLTELRVKTAKATGKDAKLADGNGLYLRVHRSGEKAFCFRYSRQGKDC